MNPLVGAGEDYAAVGGFAGEDAAAFLFGGVVGDAADGGLGEFFNLLFGLGGAVPVAEEEAALLDFGAEVVPSVDGAGIGLAEPAKEISFALAFALDEEAVIFFFVRLDVAIHPVEEPLFT